MVVPFWKMINPILIYWWFGNRKPTGLQNGCWTSRQYDNDQVCNFCHGEVSTPCPLCPKLGERLWVPKFVLARETPQTHTRKNMFVSSLKFHSSSRVRDCNVFFELPWNKKKLLINIVDCAWLAISLFWHIPIAKMKVSTEPWNCCEAAFSSI